MLCGDRLLAALHLNGVYLVKLNLENQSVVSFDFATRLSAVTEVGRNPEVDFTTLADEFHTLLPALDNATQTEADAVVLVENLAVFEATFVGYHNLVSQVAGFEVLVTHLDNLIQKTALGNFDVGVLVSYFFGEKPPAPRGCEQEREP